MVQLQPFDGMEKSVSVAQNMLKYNPWLRLYILKQEVTRQENGQLVFVWQSWTQLKNNGHLILDWSADKFLQKLKFQLITWSYQATFIHWFFIFKLSIRYNFCHNEKG